MRRPQPTNNENVFEIEELFFSRTDKRGVIEFGNDVFLRIAGYSREKILGAPHSIIRHPDMPRAVFKLLWDTIQADRPIAAYVKNLAANGNYYWVLAAALPVTGGYISIRTKPTSPLFDAAKGIYEKALVEEEAHGMEKALEYIVNCVHGAGFSSYEKFMTTALLAELKARDGALTNQGAYEQETSELGTDLEGIKNVSRHGAQLFRQMFAELEKFESASKVFQDSLTGVLESFFGFQLVSLNMQVQAEKFGSTGATLTIISSDFQKVAHDIEALLKRLSTAIEELVGQMQVGALNIALLKLQMDMVDFFVTESLLKGAEPGSATNSSGDVFTSLEQNREGFVELTSRSAQVVRELLDGLRLQIQRFETSCMEVKRSVNGLEVISQMGAIESAREHDLNEAFGFYVQKMSDFNEKLRATCRTLVSETGSLKASVALLSGRLEPAAEALGKIFELALATKSEEIGA